MRKNKALNLIYGIFLGIGMLVMVIGIIIMISVSFRDIDI